MVTTGIKNASKLPSAKEEWQQKDVMTAGGSVFSGCLTELYHITPMYETTSPSHTCTNVLTITYHIITLTSPLVCTKQWNCFHYKFHCCWQWLLPSLCPSFYELLYPHHIPNASWMDVVLWALAFTLHSKCGCLLNGLEWNGKKNMCLISTSHHLILSLQFHLSLSLSSWRLMIKCSGVEMLSSLPLQWLFMAGWS